MKTILLSTVLFLSCFLTHGQTPVWVNNIGSATADNGYTVKVSPNGNICVAGRFTGTMDLDPGPGVYNITSNGFDDIFLACYTSSGAFIWGHGIGGSRYDAAWYMTIDASDNVLICGYFQSSGIDFDPGAGVTTLPFAGGTTLTYYGDGFVAKYSSAGIFQWAKALGDNTVYDVTVALANDPAGNVYVGGTFVGSVVVSGSITLNSATSGAGYLIKYDAAGTVVWAHNYGAPGGFDCFPRSIQFGGGNLYVGGFFGGTANFNPWGTASLLTSVGMYDPYVARYDLDGNFSWVRQVACGGTGTSDDEFGSLALDAANNVYLLGWANSGTITFDPSAPSTSTVSAPGGGGNYDVIMAKYSSTGGYLWGKAIGNTGDDIGRCIDVVGANLFCTGQFRNTVDFDPSGVTANLVSAGQSDIFVGRYDLFANYICSFRIGAATEDIGFGITHDDDGRIVTTGQFGGTAVDFDPGTPSLPKTAIGATDAYLATYIPDCVIPGCNNSLSLSDTLTVCIGDTITVPAILTGPDSVLSIRWSPPTGTSDTTILTPVLTAGTSGYHYITVKSLMPANLVVNGDFSMGNTGFSSSYTFSPAPSGILLEGRYSVYTNPFSVHSGFTSMPDHTTGTGSMMILNGASSPVDVWCQTISVTPNTDYNFSAWFANCSSVTTGADVPILQFRINGVLLGTPTTVTSPPGTWVNFATTWNSGAATSANICIYDALTTASGNDFAIDDILFQKICTAPDSVYLNVDLPDTTFGTKDTTICASALPQTLTAPSGYTTYTWSTGSSSSTSISATTAGTYWVTAVSGCTATSDTFVVATNPNPVVSLGNDTAFCTGNTLVLYALQPAGTTYLWSTGSTADSIHISTSGTYSVTVTNNFGCIGSDAITVTVTPPPAVDLGPDTTNCTGVPVLLQPSVTYTGATYLWSDLVTTAPVYSATATGTYWLRVTVGGCSATDTVNVIVKYDTFTLYTNDTAICRGRAVQVLASNNPNLTYQWLPTAGIATSTVSCPLITADTSAMYVITASMPGCPPRHDSFYLDVQPNPLVKIGNTRHVCRYDSLQMHSLVAPGWYTHYSYSWSPSTFLNATTLPSVVFTAGDTTMIILTVATPAGCMGVDSTMVVVHDIGFAQVKGDTSICPRDSVQLLATGGKSYQWIPSTYLSSDTAASPWAFPITSQSYTLLAINEFACRDTLNVDLKVYPAAVIHLQDSIAIFPGDSYHIQPQTNGTSFIWTPSGGLDNRYLSNPTATPPVSTRYIVQVKTEHGCKTKDSIDVYIDDNTTIVVPNVFAPGSVNSKLYPLRRGLVTLNSFRIYNRWGNLVYESTDIDQGWDGTYKGVPQPIGVFVYTIEGTSYGGKAFSKAGNVTLLR